VAIWWASHAEVVRLHTNAGTDKATIEGLQRQLADTQAKVFYWKGFAASRTLAPQEPPWSKPQGVASPPIIDPTRPILDEDSISASFPQQYDAVNPEAMESIISMSMINSGVKSAHIMESYCISVFSSEVPSNWVDIGSIQRKYVKTLGQTLDPHTARIQTGRDSWYTPSIAVQCDPSKPLDKNEFDEFRDGLGNFYGQGYVKYGDDVGSIYTKYFATMTSFRDQARLYGESRLNYVTCIPKTACPK
jgi:hypothetical protein